MLGAGDDLLRRLGSGIRPDGARPLPPRAGLGSLSFGELLDASGRIAGGGTPIGVIEQLGVEIDPPLRERLGRVADRAASMGLARIVAVLPNGVVELDAVRRMVGRTIEDSDDAPIPGIEGVAVLGTDPQERDRLFGIGLHGPRPGGGTVGTAQPSPTPSGPSVAMSGPTGAALNRAVLALLAGLESARAQQPEQDEKRP